MARNSRRPMTSMFEQAVGAQKEEELDRLRAEIEQPKLTQTNGSGEPGFIQIPVSQIVALRLPDNLKQPRRYFDPDKLAKLRDSIQKHGQILEPILVRRAADGLYETISGERRWRCCAELRIDFMPAMVVEMSDETALEVALIAHLLSEEISAIEETDSILSLLKLRLGQTFEEVKQFLIAIKNYQSRGDGAELIEANSDKVAIIEAVLEEFGLKVSSFVSNRIPLLNLNPQIIEAVRSGEISPTSATLINRTPEHHQPALIEFSKTATKTQLKEKIDHLKHAEQSQGVNPEVGIDNSGIIMPVIYSQNDVDNSRIIMTAVPVQERIYTRLKSIRRRKSLLNDQRVQEHLAQVDSVLEKIEAIAGEKGILLS
jgi:ParB family transcriptional regulator, chromosome partitioning protein